MSKALGCGHAGFGPFGYLFGEVAQGAQPSSPAPLDATFTDELLSILGSAGGLMHDEDRGSGDSDIPAGYTFFAQFVDHDVTLDTQSALNQPGQSATTLRNQRTHSLDLDCVYGLGPSATPHLYDGTRTGFLLTGASQGRPWDLGRSPTGAALIGDPRNDENLFVGQMQLLWIRFHNAMMLTNLGAGATPPDRFEEVQRQVRYHYQWIVLYDFLQRVCHTETYVHAIGLIEKAAAERLAALQSAGHAGLPSYPLCFRHHQNGATPMPAEFSVAAFRFGHTTVRDAYPANCANLDIELFDERFGVEGFSALPERLAVDWRFQLEVDPGVDPVNTKAFDHLFPNELIVMPDPIVGATSANNRSLAFRNLARGRSLGLASGESVAELLGAKYPTVSPLDAADIFDPSAFPGKADAAERAKTLCEDGTPLFFYLMREAAIESDCERLGPAGSAILLEVFGRMLLECNSSFFFNAEESKDGSRRFVGDWKPSRNVARADQKRPLTLADIVRFVDSVDGC